MSQPERIPTRSGGFDYPPASPSTSFQTRSVPSSRDPTTTRRRRRLSGGVPPDTSRRSRSHTQRFLLNGSQQLIEHAADLIGSLSQQPTSSPAPLGGGSHPIGHSELLRIPTGAHEASLSPTWLPVGNADEDEPPRSTSTPGRRSIRRNLHEASSRLQQANNNLSLLLHEPYNRDSPYHSAHPASTLDYSDSGHPNREPAQNFWYGLARSGAAESSRTWDGDDRCPTDSVAEVAPGTSEGQDRGQAPRKRRRLNNKKPSNQEHIRQYGWQGQVVPAKLDLELLSSDGGVVSNSVVDASTVSYAAENILKDDTSVHCTYSSRCNIILQHRGGVLTTLERLVIKAPKMGFTDPVQQGLVFVSNNDDRALQWTATYPICYFPTSLFAPYFPSLADDDAAPSAIQVEYASDPTSHSAKPSSSAEQFSGSVPSAQNVQNPPSGQYLVPATSAERSAQSNPEQQAHDLSNTQDHLHARLRALEYDTYRLRQLQLRPISSPGWGEGEEMARLISRIDNRIREIEQAVANDEPSTTSTSNTSAVPTPDPSRSTRVPSRAPRRSRPNPSPRTSRPLSSSFEHVKPVARFSMHHHPELNLDASRGSEGSSDTSEDWSSSSITVHFNPPLSARYILLKLWSPRHGGNIDIQNVSAYGYVGPRFFPAIEMR